MSEKTTPIEAGAEAVARHAYAEYEGAPVTLCEQDDDPHGRWDLPTLAAGEMATAAITAALDVKEQHYGTDMTVAMLEIHGAICEDSPEDCLEYRGACVKAFEAARAALLEGSDR